MKTNRKTHMTRKLCNLRGNRNSATVLRWYIVGSRLVQDRHWPRRLESPPGRPGIWRACSSAASPGKTFHDVLWSDLEYCGILDLVSPSFYPTQSPSQPSELKFADWANAPSSAYMIAYGNLSGRRIEPSPPQDSSQTSTIPLRPSRCRKSTAALRPTPMLAG